jgi:hypothetical protein
MYAINRALTKAAAEKAAAEKAAAEKAAAETTAKRTNAPIPPAPPVVPQNPESAPPPANENGEKHDNGPPATFTSLLDVLQGAYSKLNSQNIKTPAAIQIKTDVSNEISRAMTLVETLRAAFGDSATINFSTLRNEIKELATSLKAKTYAQAMSVPGPKPSLDPKVLKVREQKTATRQERAKHEVTLTATTPATKAKLQAMSYKDITERIQTTINTNVHHDEKPLVLGVSKPTKEGTVRVRCQTEEQAKMLRTINWQSGLEGLQARQPKYGIVIHAVNKAHFNVLIDTNKPTLDRIEKENTLPIVNIAPLRRKDNKRISEYHSIVIFTTDPHAADRCIKQGLYLDYCLYPAERYTPQLQITQCYNCGKYGHRAAYCKHEHSCGKCADHHATKDCLEIDSCERKCSNCGGKHENWHHECPTRSTESHRLDNLRRQLSPYFTS